MSTSAVILPFIGGLIGAGVGSTATLLTARFNAEREHERWIRERRLEAFIDFMKAYTDLVTVLRDPEETGAYDDLSSYGALADIMAAQSRISLLSGYEASQAVIAIIAKFVALADDSTPGHRLDIEQLSIDIVTARRLFREELGNKADDQNA